jgi:hypothetical protein
MDSKSQRWHHPGGKLRELGAETLTETQKNKELFEEIEVVKPFKGEQRHVYN